MPGDVGVKRVRARQHTTIQVRQTKVRDLDTPKTFTHQTDHDLDRLDLLNLPL